MNPGSEISRRALFLTPALLTGAGRNGTVLWKAGEGEYHTYRIPSVIRGSRGVLLAFCEGRRNGRGDAGDIDLLMKRSTDGGRTWGETQVVADFSSNTIGNPCPVVDSQGAIHLLLRGNPGAAHEKDIIAGTAGGTRTVWVIVSRDTGRTWEQPREITATTKLPDWSWYATGPGNGIRLRSGRLIIPCDHVEADNLSWSHVLYSDNNGASWQIGGKVGPLCNECAIAECTDGSLLLNMRSYAGRHRRAISRSYDGGLTWSPIEDNTALIEPVCEASLIRANKSLIFSNPAAETRRNMTVRTSTDNGHTWKIISEIHPGPAGYSSLVHLGRNRAGLLYEAGVSGPYEKICWAEVTI